MHGLLLYTDRCVSYPMYPPITITIDNHDDDDGVSTCMACSCTQTAVCRTYPKYPPITMITTVLIIMMMMI